MKNLIGQQLSVGDAVKYVTRGRPPRIRKGIISRFILSHKRVYDHQAKTLAIIEHWRPVIRSWTPWCKGGFGRVLTNCDLVFPIDEKFDDIKEEMVNK